MAKETITKLIDDLDGSAAAETVKFGLDGREYEIDLNGKNAKKLRTELAPFVEHGVRVTAPRVARGTTPPTSADKQRRRAIRDWALAKGYEVSERGRLAQHLIDEFNATH